jgi:hypothetical protein
MPIRQRQVTSTLLKRWLISYLLLIDTNPNLIPLLIPLSNLDFNSIEE